MSRYWLIIFLLVGIFYAAHEGYIPGAQKYVKQIEFEVQSFMSNANPQLSLNEHYLKNYPVEVKYDIKRKTEKDLLGKTYSYYRLTLYFKNTGSESVNFVVGGLAIVDNSGKTHSPQGIILDAVTVYPGGVKTLTYRFGKIPTGGKLYIDIYRTGNFNVGLGQMSTQLEKVETFSMPFTYNGK